VSINLNDSGKFNPLDREEKLTSINRVMDIDSSSTYVRKIYRDKFVWTPNEINLRQLKALILNDKR